MSQQFVPIPALVSQQAKLHADETIIRVKDRGIWKTISWTQLNTKVQEIGVSLQATGFGYGDVIAILSDARPEAVYADLAILGCGAASVAIDPDDDPDRVWHVMSSSGSRLAFVENEEQLDKLLSIRSRCPALSRIIIFDMKGLRDFDDANCVALSNFIQSGDVVNWTASIQAITPDQSAVVQFPRGESFGIGRTLTHGDLVHMVGAARLKLPMQPNDERLAVLQLSDITERVWGLYLALETRCVSNYLERPDTAIENLQELQPTVLGADAAIWDGLHALATARAKAATSIQRLAYQWALRVSILGGPKARLAHLLVLQAVRKEFGMNKMRIAYVEGAFVSREALDWALGLGIVIQRVDDLVIESGEVDERHQALRHKGYA